MATQAEAQPDSLLKHLCQAVEGNDVLLPQQFFEAHPAPIPPGEKRIRYRVLMDAVREFRKYSFAASRRERRLYNETYAWILANDHQWPYSFVNLCGVFSIEPEAARSALLRWRRIERAKRAKAAAQDTSAGPECSPSLPAEGGTDEVAQLSEGRGEEQAA